VLENSIAERQRSKVLRMRNNQRHQPSDSTVWCAGYEIPLDSIERIKAMIAAAAGSALETGGCPA
jgi:hypothetical protein